MGDIEVGAHLLREDLHVAHQRLALRQRPAHQGNQLRQGLPLRLPAAQRPLVLLNLAGVEGGHQTRGALGGGQDRRAGHRIALMRHRRRAAAPFRYRLAHLSHFGLHQQGEVVSEFPQGAADASEPGACLQQPIALAVPRGIRQRQTEVLRQRLANRRSLRFQRVQGPRGAAELQHQQTRTHLPQPLLPAQQRVESARQLQTKGHRQRMLHPGPARHHAVAMTVGLPGEGRQQSLKQLLGGIQRPAQLEHQPGVDSILTGGAPVNVARGVWIPRFYLGRQLFHQRDRQITRPHSRLAQGGKIDRLVAAGRDNRPDRRRRHHPAGGLRLGQRRFKIQHALHPLRVAEPVGERTAAQHRGQQTHSGSLNTFNNQGDPLPDADTHGAQRVAAAGPF